MQRSLGPQLHHLRLPHFRPATCLSSQAQLHSASGAISPSFEAADCTGEQGGQLGQTMLRVPWPRHP